MKNKSTTDLLEMHEYYKTRRNLSDKVFTLLIAIGICGILCIIGTMGLLDTTKITFKEIIYQISIGLGLISVPAIFWKKLIGIYDSSTIRLERIEEILRERNVKVN